MTSSSLSALKPLFGNDEAAYEQFVQQDVAVATEFAKKALEYHDALNELGTNEVEPTEIVDEAVARLLTEKRGAKLTLGKRLQALILEVVREMTQKIEERERRETSVEANVKDPIEEAGFRTLGEHVLNFWQPDQDASVYEYIGDTAVPTPDELLDLKDKQTAIYAALATLPKTARENFVLMAVNEWSLHEVAEWRGVADKKIKAELAGTQKKLLAALRDSGELENLPPRQLPQRPEHD